MYLASIDIDQHKERRKKKKRTISTLIFRIGNSRTSRWLSIDENGIEKDFLFLIEVLFNKLPFTHTHTHTQIFHLNINDLRLSYSLTSMYTYTSQYDRIKQSIHNSSCTHIHPIIRSQLSIVILSENAQAVRLISIPHILILHHDDARERERVIRQGYRHSHWSEIHSIEEVLHFHSDATNTYLDHWQDSFR